MNLDLALDATADIDVYDVGGRIVRHVGSTRMDAGPHRLTFDGNDDAGRPLASGVYFYTVRANGTAQTRKLIIQH
jgi:flagellar hook assembly protein FlgD